MTRSPFSLYKKKLKSGLVWYVRFYDPKTKSYPISKSTRIPCTGKKGKYHEALQFAQSLYKTYIEEKSNSELFLNYLDEFWQENSPYMKSKRLVEKKPLSSNYILLNRMGIETHVKTYKPFQHLKLNELKPGLFEDWKIWMLEKKPEKGKQPAGAKRINDVLQAMSVPIHYLIQRGDLEIDPLRTVKKIPYKPKEKGILTYEEALKIQDIEEDDVRIKLAVLLAVWAGMRRGEIRGLRWCDIDFVRKIISIQNNYVDNEGSKGCKWDSGRVVPLPSCCIPLLQEVQEIHPYFENDCYLLFDIKSLDKPCSQSLIRTGFKRVMKKIGISEKMQKERNITFHGMRHTFVTILRMQGIQDIVVQALAGHKNIEMMNLYSHAGQVIDFDEARKRIESLLRKKVPESPNDCSHGII